ncbi:hypothetical protein ACQUSR_21215 [Streptomyces sp. P1-3]|uniref:hypothetical protein n=1 Tax=Streptomyces sp. P1-3 TaxID=3421658 RepID=UPI003D36FD15
MCTPVRFRSGGRSDLQESAAGLALSSGRWRPGAHIRGIQISIRHVFATAALVSAALTLTACGPEDDSAGASDSSPSASASTKAKPSAGSTAGNVEYGCYKLAKGHKVIWVDHVEGAMNNVIAREAVWECGGSGEGVIFKKSEGEPTTYSMASGDTKVAIIDSEGRHDRTAKDGGIAHVKSCADPNGETYDGGQAPKVDKSTCGTNFYDIAVGPDNKITEMTEQYSG